MKLRLPRNARVIMIPHPTAGQPATREILVNLGKLENDYYARRLDLDDPRQLVSLGTSGHRSTSLDGSFTEAHILAITRATCDYRRVNERSAFYGERYPCLVGSGAAYRARSVAANDVATVKQSDDGFMSPYVQDLGDVIDMETIAVSSLKLGVDPSVRCVQNLLLRKIDSPIGSEIKSDYQSSIPTAVRASELAGEPDRGKMSRASGNDSSVGGSKVLAAGLRSDRQERKHLCVEL
jgi:phosphoglucomutase